MKVRNIRIDCCEHCFSPPHRLEWDGSPPLGKSWRVTYKCGSVGTTTLVNSWRDAPSIECLENEVDLLRCRLEHEGEDCCVKPRSRHDAPWNIDIGDGPQGGNCPECGAPPVFLSWEENAEARCPGGTGAWLVTFECGNREFWKKRGNEK